ncbi:hypothetical protein C9439_00505, partial [archaeon SCG-AAA382B04]
MVSYISPYFEKVNLSLTSRFKQYTTLHMEENTHTQTPKTTLTFSMSGITTMTLPIPSHRSKSVQKASDTIPGATPDQIASRVKLLLLPGELQNAVDNEELTPMEEAEAFAEYVDVRVSKKVAKEIEKQNYETTTRENERTVYYANFKDYIDFVLNNKTVINDIKTPGLGSPSAEEAAETIPGATPDQIANRVKLLLLPGE